MSLRRDYGFAAGMDYHVTPRHMLRLCARRRRHQLECPAPPGLGDGRSDAFQAGAYGARHFGSASTSRRARLHQPMDHHQPRCARSTISYGDASTARAMRRAGEGGQRYSASCRSAAPSSASRPMRRCRRSGSTPRASARPISAAVASGCPTVRGPPTDTRSEFGARFDSALWAPCR